MIRLDRVINVNGEGKRRKRRNSDSNCEIQRGIRMESESLISQRWCRLVKTWASLPIADRKLISVRGVWVQVCGNVLLFLLRITKLQNKCVKGRDRKQSLRWFFNFNIPQTDVLELFTNSTLEFWFLLFLFSITYHRRQLEGNSLCVLIKSRVDI